MRRWRWIASFSLIVACGGVRPPTYSATFTDRSIRLESYAKKLRAAEPAAVSQLAGDTRVFARLHPKTTGGDDPFDTAWVGRPFIDPFAFTGREANVRRARAKLRALTIPASLGAELAEPSQGADASDELRGLRLEQQTCQRMIDAESDRLERERTLPERAADLVRAMILAWPTSPSPAAMGNLESTVAWRLENLLQSLTPNALSEAERDDTRAALAEMAPLVAPLPHGAAAMAKLRSALDATWVTPYANEDEATMDKELALYVGAPMSFDALDDAFASAARTFDVQVDAGLSVLDAAARARVRARAVAIVFHAPTCAPRVPLRTALDLAPPDERAWSCALLHALDDARTDEDELAADLAWRDAITAARWAVSTHGSVRTKEAALRLGTLEAGETPAEAARLWLLATARPLRAVAAGVAASILTRAGGAHVRPRARKWRAIGDAPMDLVAPLLDPKKT